MNGEKQDAVCKSNLRAKMSTTVLFVCCSPHSSHPPPRAPFGKSFNFQTDPAKRIAPRKVAGARM